MKTNAQMDELLKKAKKNPELLKDIIPLYQSFAGYGNIAPYQHYQVQVNEICEKWQGTISLAVIIQILTDAWIQYCQGKLDYAFRVLSELSSTHDLKIDPEHYGFAEVMMGTCMLNRGDIDVALVHLLNASKYINENGPLATYSCFAYYHLAELHMQIKDLADAGKYYEKALTIARRVNHKVSMFRSLIGLGAWYHASNDHENCIKYFNLALKVEPISEALKSRALRDLGVHYLSRKNYKKAIAILEESYQLAIESGYSNPASTSLIHLGEAYLNLKKPDLALSKLNEALKISLELKTKAKQMEIESLLATTHEALQNFEKAYEHLKSAQKLEKEINTVKQSEIFKIKNRIIEEQKEIIEKERDRSEKLLLNILPARVAEELKETGRTEPRHYKDITILFSDFQGFTELVSSIPAITLVTELNDIFSQFDDIMDEAGLEKIETIGDAYLAAGGIPVEIPDHALRCVQAAKLMIDYLDRRNLENQLKWNIRIGIHSGPIVAGVVGKKKFAYDLFGDTINTASRIETAGKPGKINISASTYHLIKDKFNCIPRGKIHAKGKGDIDMYFVNLEKEEI